MIQHKIQSPLIVTGFQYILRDTPHIGELAVIGRPLPFVADHQYAVCRGLKRGHLQRQRLAQAVLGLFASGDILKGAEHTDGLPRSVKAYLSLRIGHPLAVVHAHEAAVDIVFASFMQRRLDSPGQGLAILRMHML